MSLCLCVRTNIVWADSNAGRRWKLHKKFHELCFHLQTQISQSRKFIFCILKEHFQDQLNQYLHSYNLHETICNKIVKVTIFLLHSFLPIEPEMLFYWRQLIVCLSDPDDSLDNFSDQSSLDYTDYVQALQVKNMTQSKR